MEPPPPGTPQGKDTHTLAPAPSTPPPKIHIPYDDPQDESNNLDELGNSIDILRTNNLKLKVVDRKVCYFGTTKAGIKTYLEKEPPLDRAYHKWTLPPEVKYRLYDLTNPDNYKTVLELRNTFNVELGVIIDEDGKEIGTNQEGLAYFVDLLKEKEKEKKFERYSSASKDTKFFPLLKVKLNELLNKKPDLFPPIPENNFIGTYTKRGKHHSHAEVVIWDPTILQNIHKGKSYVENTVENPYQYDTIEAPEVAQKGPAGKRKDREEGEEDGRPKKTRTPPPFSLMRGGKRKTQKKTKKKSKTSNKKSKRKNSKCLHKKKGGSYKKKTKKQRRNKKKASLKKK